MSTFQERKAVRAEASNGGRTWICADHHFGHKNIIRFKRDDGSPLRDFETIEEHDEGLISRHNAVVNHSDRVYCLGDFGNWRTAARLNGRLVLVKGNHDTDKLSQYAQYFDDVRACVVKKGFILTHIPIHPASLSRWKLNIHGHLHANVVMQDKNPYAKGDSTIPDDRYKCVSMEHLDYSPILLDTVLKERNII